MTPVVRERRKRKVPDDFKRYLMININHQVPFTAPDFYKAPFTTTSSILTQARFRRSPRGVILEILSGQTISRRISLPVIQ